MARSITVIPASQPYRVGGRTQQKTRNLRVAAYCRVSTDQEEQLNSFENQVEYYTKYIQDNPLYQMAGIYADEGISGTNTKKREEFKRMIRDCEEGKIDLVITKSISRFARNTQDCLEYSRRLKNLGIGIFFENYCLPYYLRWLRTNQEIFRRTVNGAYEASLKREFRRWIVQNFLDMIKVMMGS